jgi:hypothetical protein
MVGQRFLMVGVLFMLLSFVVANVGEFGKVGAQAKKEGASPPRPIKKEVVFEDKFERDDLGEMYDILNSDPKRLTLSDGKLLIVATKPRKNLILLRQTYSGDFVSTVAVTMQVTKNNSVGLYYWVDGQNYLVVGVHGGALEAHIRGEGRQPIFAKVVDGQANHIRPRLS